MDDEAKRKLELINKRADFLEEVAKRYGQLRSFANEENVSATFIDLVDAAGGMTESAIRQVGCVLDLLWKITIKKERG